MLLSINGNSVIGLSTEEAEALLKGLPRGTFRLTVVAPFKDVTMGSLPTPTQKGGEMESIIKETLEHSSGTPLGFEIEGGSDTPLKYIYIKSLANDSPALNCGKFKNGDQMIMVGDICLIGMTYSKALETLEFSSTSVEVVAQRKNSIPSLSANETSGKEEDSSIGNLDSNNSVEVAVKNEGETTNLGNVSIKISTEDLNAENLASRNQRMTDPGHAPKSLITEDRITVELTRNSGEKLGIGIVGGTDNPNQKHIHVSQYM